METRKRIAGEYSRVSQWTTEYSLLEKAHQTFITRYEAEKIVSRLAPMVSVSYRGYKGRAYKKQLKIVLPTGRRPGVVIGRLRVGIVLHEIAHIYDENRGHGRSFVAMLDNLVRVYYAGYQVENSVPAAAGSPEPGAPAVQKSFIF